MAIGIGYGSSVSHTGKDIVIYSNFSKVERYREGFYLFWEDEKDFKKLPDNIYEIFNIDISKSSLLKNAKDSKELYSIYKILPSELKNDKEIVFERYNYLKKKAEKKHREEKEEANVSPYYYVTVRPIDKILMNYIESFSDNDYFKTRALALFNLDFPNYLNKEIKRSENAIHIIKNKDDYFKLFDMEYELQKDDDYIKYLEETISDIQKELDGCIDEYNNLKNRKYTFIEKIKSVQKQDEEKKMKLGDIEMKNGTIEFLQRDLSEWKSKCMEHKKIYYELKNKCDELKEILIVPFEDYSEAYKWEDYEEGWEKVSLNLLLDKKDEFIKRLEYFEKQKKCTENYKEYAKSFLQVTNEVEEDCIENN